jgi:hypothetical protein
VLRIQAFDTDPDPAFHFETDPAFQSDMDPDPTVWSGSGSFQEVMYLKQLRYFLDIFTSFPCQ